jgi:N-acetyl-alpha-D-glucosaminyl L-malate synthase BshA
VFERPRVIVTLHGTDVMLLGADDGYGPAIRHALENADGVTTVSRFLRREVHTHLDFYGPVEVIPNFYAPHAPARSRGAVRAELGVSDTETLLIHSSNLRPVKRIDLLLETLARIPAAVPLKLLVLAGGNFAAFAGDVERLGIGPRLIVRENVVAVEDYLNAVDAAVFTSEIESFCLGILEAMTFGCPSAAFAVGGIPEVVQHDQSGLLVPFGDTAALAHALQDLATNPTRRAALGAAAKARAAELFSADRIVSEYLAFYRKAGLRPG